MHFVTIVSIIASVAVAIYAATTCSDILNALNNLASSALSTDCCSSSTSCSGDTAKVDITCTYQSALTDANIKTKCDEVKSATAAATSTIAACSITCSSQNSKKTFVAHVTCNPSTSSPGDEIQQCAGSTSSSPLSFLSGMLSGILNEICR